MAMTLSSKTFVLLEDKIIPFKDIIDWYESVDQRNSSTQLVIKLVSTEKKQRQGKKVAENILRELVAKASVKEDAYWKKGDYMFFFVSRRFFWKEEEIYLTSAEILFIFRWIILGEEVLDSQWFLLNNIRRRLGRAFLAELDQERRGYNNTNRGKHF